jgi:predicted DNA-binding transcriptional regulator AlpA
MRATPELQLLLKPNDAAKALAISTRQLWTLTNRGEIPSVRLGHCLRYDPASLRDWIQSQLVAKPTPPP